MHSSDPLPIPGLRASSVYGGAGGNMHPMLPSPSGRDRAGTLPDFAAWMRPGEGTGGPVERDRFLKEAPSGSESSIHDSIGNEAEGLNQKAEGLNTSMHRSDPLREAFCDFVGQTLYSQVIASMRSAQQEPAYFHGGQAERIFQGQLDQILTEEMSKASAETVAGPMADLFLAKRRG